MTPRLAPVTESDLPAVRDLQIASWRLAYRGMLPDAFLQEDVPRILADRWASLPSGDWMVTGLWLGNDLAGFVSVDRGREGGPYVDNLHVASAGRGRGFGARLMADAAAHLMVQGAATLWLTVIRENAVARAFYRRIGGVEGPDRPHLLYGQPVTILPVRWHDLAALAKVGEVRQKDENLRL